MKHLPTSSLFAMFAFGSLVGCNPFLSPVSLDHPTHRELISADLNKQFGVVVKQGNVIPDSTAIPVDAFTSYCERDGGNLQQVSEDKDAAHAGMKALSGYFSCRDSNRTLWQVQINVFRGEALSGDQGYYMNIRDVPLIN